MPPDALLRSYASVKVGDEMDIDRFAELLVSIGYEQTDIVDRHGEFSRRGGLVDVYASNEDHPIRIELFGDEIESIRHFDSASQRSVDRIPNVLILPAREVLIDGRDCTALPPARRPTATVFQDYALFPHMSVGGNVGFGLRMRHVPRDLRERRVRDALRLVGLPDAAQRRPHELSGGQIGRASCRERV